jgi:hypothetical protein
MSVDCEDRRTRVTEGKVLWVFVEAVLSGAFGHFGLRIGLRAHGLSPEARDGGGSDFAIINWRRFRNSKFNCTV